MKIVVLKERHASEKRVAVTPDTVAKLVALGAEVIIESGSGKGAHITDSQFKDAGASTSKETEAIVAEADIVLKVQPSGDVFDEVAHMKKGALYIGMLSPLNEPDHIKRYADAGISAIALEMIPRITRAQSMDVLSSQSNLAGYKAVLDALSHYDKVVPMMMTAAGTLSPAKVVVMGAGVAGLQAIATARRLGAVVSAFDVRKAAKEQVESLGAKFIEVESDETDDSETEGGYAKEMSEDYKQKQQDLISDVLKKTDIVITTALIPGKPAPVLVTEEHVKNMKPGSVVVDLAAGAGGNCPLSEAGKVIHRNNVSIIGYDNMPSRLAVDASRLFARNVLHLLELIIDKETQSIALNLEDDIIKGALIAHDGKALLDMKGGQS